MQVRTTSSRCGVLNPTHERIDGIVLEEMPKQARVIPYRAGAAYNHGGITGSVELLAVPASTRRGCVRASRPETGTIKIRANVRNATKTAVAWSVEFTVAPAASGETLCGAVVEQELAPGDTIVETEMKIDQPRLWELNDPFLYRVTARVGDDERIGAVRLPRVPVRKRLLPPQRPAGVSAFDAHLQSFSRRPEAAARSRHGPPRPARLEGDGIQHDPVHLGRCGALSTRPVRRDRSNGL